MKLLQDAEWSHWSDREIGRHAKVGHQLVIKMRAELPPVTGPATSGRTFTHSKTGKPTQMKTGRIGKRPATQAALPNCCTRHVIAIRHEVIDRQ